MKSNIYHWRLPVKKENIQQLHVGDQIYLSGLICTGRDQVHKRILQYNKIGTPLPERFARVQGSAIYHMGPIVKTMSDGSYTIVSGGPTTSGRMNPVQTQVAKILQLRFVIGKGGMEGVQWQEIPAIYLHFPGGVGALPSKFIQRVEGVEWIEFGPEAAWFLDILEFGPLIVAIDIYGGNLYSRQFSPMKSV